MTWYVVRMEHQTKGAAFEDKIKAREIKMAWEERYDQSFELIEREKPLEGEEMAAEAAMMWESLMEAIDG